MHLKTLQTRPRRWDHFTQGSQGGRQITDEPMRVDVIDKLKHGMVKNVAVAIAELGPAAKSAPKLSQWRIRLPSDRDGSTIDKAEFIDS